MISNEKFNSRIAKDEVRVFPQMGQGIQEWAK